MMRDAESHSDEDKRKKQLAEAKNEADTLVYTVEKSLKDYGDKLNEAEKREIEEALEKCRKAKDTSSEPSEIKSATEELTNKSHKLAEHLYKGEGAQAAAGAGAGAGTSGDGSQAGAKGPEEEVVEAEFEDVDKEKKES
jgi:molecular chaperone DnaK